MERNSFVFYRSFWDAICCLPKKDRLPFIEALCSYAFDEIEPDMSGTKLGLFIQLKAAIDSNKKRFADGSKGGRPRKKPVVSEKITSGFESENHYIQDEKENENENENEKGVGKPTALSSAGDLIMYLNERAGRAFQQTDTNLSLAESLLGSYSEELIRDVIDNKVAMWGSDPKMAGYLRPKTLFNLENFENYLEEPIVEEVAP